jgi:hypothetical protein
VDGKRATVGRDFLGLDVDTLAKFVERAGENFALVHDVSNDHNLAAVCEIEDARVERSRAHTELHG